MSKRFVLEGEWSGYRSSQQRIVHREVITEARANKFNLDCIRYTDGTTLSLHVRPALYREKIEQINGYGSLIRKAERTGRSYVSVEDLR